MTTTRSRTRWCAALLAAVALAGAAACSKADSAQPRSPAPPGGVTTTGPISRADIDAARTALIRVGDLPAGFKEVMTTSSADSSTSPYEEAPECKAFAAALDPTDGQRTAKNKTTFKNEGKSQVEDEIEEEVEIYRDAETVQTLIRVAGDPGFRACFQAVFNGAFGTSPAGVTVGAITVEPAADLPAASSVGLDSVSGLVIEVPVSGNGRSVTVRFELVLLMKGRAAASLTLLSSGALDAAPTIQAAVNRLRAVDAS